MCPACLTTAALVMAGTTSAGGITAFIVHKLFRRRAKSPPGRIGHTGPSSK